MCDRPHDKAVRSPWTDGAWIVAEDAIPEGWQWRYGVTDPWYSEPTTTAEDRWLVEARPKAKP